jgi:hypothetical protein
MGENFLFDDKEILRNENKKLDTDTLYFFLKLGMLFEIWEIKALGSLY